MQQLTNTRTITRAKTNETLEVWSWLEASAISKALKRGCCEVVVMGMIVDAPALQPLNAPWPCG